jgi:CheY-like chemotaxis protein
MMAEKTSRRVLVVEDEMIVALFIEDLLEELGYSLAGVVSRLDEAMKRAGDGTFDLAILDVHVNGKDIFPFAEELVGHGIPFLFATGYGERAIPDHLRGHPTLQKPFRPDELAAIIGKLTSQPAS